MAGILDGIRNLISSLFEILNGIFSTFLSTIQTIFNTILSMFSSLFHLVQDLVASIFDLMSGVVGFVLGNIVIIGVLVAAYVGYSAYRQKHQGGGITGGKKRA